TAFLVFAALILGVIPVLARRGNPVPPVTISDFKSQFYIIDSDDDNTDSRQPTYKFVDTLYDAAHWHRVTGFTNNDDGYAETAATDSILYYYSNAQMRLPPRYISTNGLMKLSRDTLTVLGYNAPVTSPANGSMPAGFYSSFQGIVC